MLRIKYAVHMQYLVQQTEQSTIIIIINSYCHLAQILYGQSAARNMDYVKCTVQILNNITTFSLFCSFFICLSP